MLNRCGRGDVCVCAHEHVWHMCLYVLAKRRNTFHSFIYFKDLSCFMWKAELQRDRKIFHQLIHCPNICNSWSCPVQNRGQELFQVSHGLAIFCCSFRPLAGSWITVDQLGFKPASMWNARTADEGLMCYTIVPAVFGFFGCLLFWKGESHPQRYCLWGHCLNARPQNSIQVSQLGGLPRCTTAGS